MDWLKLFALLVVVTSVQITAEGVKKKIRIHLPQKVKHIHHHKKIYITNHPAPSQYAPAYLPGVKGAAAGPTNVRRPPVANIVPYSLELYGDARGRLPGVSPAASKLLPLYKARGHYGPHHSEWDEQEYDLVPSPEPADIYAPSAYSALTSNAAAPSNYPSKRVKILKAKELPRKKVIRKVKPKRVYLRGRAPLQSQPHVDEEIPVSSFHEQFYSDLEETGTIRKIRKPPRIEKIVEGDTEHIHTYSEEHIHKVVYDDDSKVTGVASVNPVGSISALNARHAHIPIRNAQRLVALVGSMGTPSHLEYTAYNPRDVTHDHIFHDHGVLPTGAEVTKEILRLPPKVSYNSQGLPIRGDTSKKYQGKYSHVYNKQTNPTTDFSYYESIYTPNHRPKKVQRPIIPTPYSDSSSEVNLDDFRPVPSFRFKEKKKPRKVTPQYGNGIYASNFQLEQASVPAPFSVSSTVVHDYDPKSYAGVGFSGPSSAGFAKYRDPLVDFKDSSSNNFDYDTFAPSSNVYTSEDKNDSTLSLQGKTGTKSVSTQNISFGGRERQTFVDHLAASSNALASISEGSPTAAESFNDYDRPTDPATPTPYTIKETSAAHQYYSAMALKALHGNQPEASNYNMHYAETPIPANMTSESPDAATNSYPPNYYNIQSSDVLTPEHELIPEKRQRRGEKNTDSNDESRPRNNAIFKDSVSSAQGHNKNKTPYVHAVDTSTIRGTLKYGDKIEQN